MDPSITIVVPTRNRGDLITETLRELLTLDYPALEILVVDQSTDQVTQEAVYRVAGEDHRVRLECTQTVGLSAGRNIGAHLSKADVVAYVDDDCIVTPDWLRLIVSEFRNPEVSAVSGRLLPYGFTGRTGTEAGFNPSVQRAEFIRRAPPWYVGHGGNIAFRRLDLLEIGGFDPLMGTGGLFGSGEDSDIIYRLLVAGKRIVYCPDALVYHKEWKDWPARSRMERAYGIGAGAQFAKYIRCGDLYGVRLLLTWIWELGVRRVGAGLFKWHNFRNIYLGYCQLVYPWIGICRSLRYRIDPRLMTYVEC